MFYMAGAVRGALAVGVRGVQGCCSTETERDTPWSQLCHVAHAQRAVSNTGNEVTLKPFHSHDHTCCNLELPLCAGGSSSWVLLLV